MCIEKKERKSRRMTLPFILEIDSIGRKFVSPPFFASAQNFGVLRAAAACRWCVVLGFSSFWECFERRQSVNRGVWIIIGNTCTDEE